MPVSNPPPDDVAFKHIVEENDNESLDCHKETTNQNLSDVECGVHFLSAEYSMQKEFLNFNDADQTPISPSDCSCSESKVHKLKKYLNQGGGASHTNTKRSAGLCLVRKRCGKNITSKESISAPASEISSNYSDFSSNGVLEALVIRRGTGKFFELPKGHVENGETLAETAVREIREETGLLSQIVIGDFLLCERYFVDTISASGRREIPISATSHNSELLSVGCYYCNQDSAPSAIGNATYETSRILPDEVTMSAELDEKILSVLATDTVSPATTDQQTATEDDEMAQNGSGDIYLSAKNKDTSIASPKKEHDSNTSKKEHDSKTSKEENDFHRPALTEKWVYYFRATLQCPFGEDCSFGSREIATSELRWVSANEISSLRFKSPTVKDAILKALIVNVDSDACDV